MSIEKTRLGTDTNVPEEAESGWSEEVTAQISDLLDATNDTHCWVDSSSSIIGVKLLATSSTIANGGSLDPNACYPVIQVEGSGSAVTLSSVTAIEDGATDGQMITLVGNSASNSVTIQHDANVQLNGYITLNQYDVLRLRWDATLEDWIEEYRSN